MLHSESLRALRCGLPDQTALPQPAAVCCISYLYRICISDCGSTTSPGGRMRVRSVAVLAVLGVLAGCRGSTDPQIGVNGTWSYAASNLAGNVFSNLGRYAGYVCSLNMNMSATQSGSIFTGTWAGPADVLGGPHASVTCTQGYQQLTYYLHGRITNGTISGDTVAFDAVSVVASWSFTGTISGNSMSGNMSIFVPMCDCVTDTAIVTQDTLVVTGQWSATRS
jgi:hypothetical protein